MKQFQTVALSAAERKKVEKQREENAHHIMLDDVDCKFYYPGDSQAMVLAASFRGRLDGASMATLMGFMLDMADRETKEHLQDRMMDPMDPFELASEGDIPSLMDMIEDLVETWSGKAQAKQPSSAPQRSRSGTKSTGGSSQKGSTSSRSRSRAGSR